MSKIVKTPHCNLLGFHPAVVRFCMWFRTAALAFALCSCASLSRAAASTAETIYYIGEASTTGADGSIDRHTCLLARTSDQSVGTIAERVVTFTRGAYAELHAVDQAAYEATRAELLRK